MSNVKQVLIRGTMPFSITDSAAARSWLGLLNGPSMGLRIKYGATSGVPLPNGGVMTMYDFTIYGQEAMAFKALDTMVSDLAGAGAEIEVNEVVDIEAE